MSRPIYSTGRGWSRGHRPKVRCMHRKVREQGGRGGPACPGDLLGWASRGSTRPKVHGGGDACCCALQTHFETWKAVITFRMGLHALTRSTILRRINPPSPPSSNPKLYLLVTLPTLVRFPGAAAAGRRPTLGATMRSAAGAAATVSCTRRG